MAKFDVSDYYIYALKLVFFPALVGLGVADKTDYGLVIDAGSSGSRLRVYEWPKRTDGHTVPDFTEKYSYKKTPGISAYVDNLDGLDGYMSEFIDQALAHVPKESRETTPIYVMATAGMRLLLEYNATKVMDKIDQFLQSNKNPFEYESENTRILSGEEEGVFAWIAANYLRGYFKNIPDSSTSVGILEMGGASTQIAFVYDGDILADKFPVTLSGTTYPIYVHSYLSYGQELTDRAIKEDLYSYALYANNTEVNEVQDPCMLKGDSQNYTIDEKEILFSGTGKPSGCYKLLDDLVYKVQDEDHCSPKPCAIGSVYQPVIRNQTFFALSAYPLALTSINVIEDQGSFSPASTLEAAYTYCSKHIDVVRNETGSTGQYLSADCMMGVYIPILMVKGYGFSNSSTQVVAVKTVNGRPVEWPLGAIIYETSRKEWPCTMPEPLPITSSGVMNTASLAGTNLLLILYVYIFKVYI